MTTTSGPVHAFTDDALGDGDATEVARRVAAREVSPSELVDAAIARLEKVNPTLNGMAFEDFERARSRAAGPRARRGVFGGVPSATKDNIHVAGMPMTMGSLAMPRTRGTTDGAFTRQFLDTGVIPICSTTTPEFGWTATTERVNGDVTRNPWNPNHSSGGSSGGSAALVAAGVLPIAHGNDGGGSIRIPASACGLVGLKATRGRLRPDPSTASMPVKVVTDGVLARSVRDVAAFFASAEQTWANPRLTRIGHVDGAPARRLRIGVTVDSPLAPPTDADTRAAVEQTAALLESLGHTVVPYDPPVPKFFKSDFEDYWSLLAFAIATDGPRMFGKEFDKKKLDPLTLGLAKRFRRRSAKTPLFLARLAASGPAAERRFGDIDLALTPVLCHSSPEIGYLSADQPFEQHFERLVAYAGFTPLHNATGSPAISVPMGQTAGGFPIGVMFSAKRGEERRLLEIAFELEEAQPFKRIQDAPASSGTTA
jgi:amidase